MVPLQCRDGSLGSSGVPTVESDLTSCGGMQVRSPLELEKQCQASCRIDLGIGGFLSRCHRAVTPAIVFELILRVTVESVHGSQVYLECIGTWGILKWWHHPWSSSRVSS